MPTRITTENALRKKTTSDDDIDKVAILTMAESRLKRNTEIPISKGPFWIHWGMILQRFFPCSYTIFFKKVLEGKDDHSRGWRISGCPDGLDEFLIRKLGGQTTGLYNWDDWLLS
jgi:hypothetical protein